MLTKRCGLIMVVSLVLTVSTTIGMAQNLNVNVPLTLPEQPEVPVSPAASGTAPGTLTNETTGTNPLTGLPCAGVGSLAVTEAGALPATSSSPPDDGTPTDALPSLNSVFGSGSTLGSC
jgi:hypothetical protein